MWEIQSALSEETDFDIEPFLNDQLNFYQVHTKIFYLDGFIQTSTQRSLWIFTLNHLCSFSIFQDDPDQFGHQILHNVSLSNNGSLVIWPWLLSIGDNIGLFPMVFGDRLRYGTYNDPERSSKDLYIMEETVKNYIYGYPWHLDDKTLSRPYSWPSEGLLEVTGKV